MEIKIKKILPNIEKVVKVLLIMLGMVGSFMVGYYINKLDFNNKPITPEHIKRSEVTIAIDEYSNFMIITKKDGTYTLLDDSIGRAIFDIYAKNIWSGGKTIDKNENKNNK